MLKIIILLFVAFIIYNIYFYEHTKYNYNKNYIYGCTNKKAINYDKNAQKENFSCIFKKKMLPSKYRVYNNKVHYNKYFDKNVQVKKIETYQLVDKFNSIKNSKLPFLKSFNNILFKIYYDTNDNKILLELLTSIIVPIEFPHNLLSNKLNSELYNENSKINLDNNKLIIVSNGKKLIDIKVSYKLLDKEIFSLNIIPYNKNTSNNDQGIVPYNDNNITMNI
jgi:hypothetical protein